MTGADLRFAGVQVVLCDADGNLFPSEEPAFVASAAVTNQFLARSGVSRRYDPDELRLAATGLSFRTTLTAIAAEHGVPAPVGAALQEWVQTEKEAVTAYLRTALRPDPDVLEPLTAIADRYGVAAVSSSADERIAACFEVTGLARFFPAARRFSAEDSLPRPTSKPDPAIYRYAVQTLGLEVEQTVAVEDSVVGATSAAAAGVATIGNLQFVQPPERAERRAALEHVGVAAVVGSWDEVATLLGVDPAAGLR